MSIRSYCTFKIFYIRVGETSEATPHPETLGAVAQMISQQEAAVSNLDNQRVNIISMLQRGRELAKIPQAPEFIKEQVANLETKWNVAYNSTLEKLNKLKGKYFRKKFCKWLVLDS